MAGLGRRGTSAIGLSVLEFIAGREKSGVLIRLGIILRLPFSNRITFYSVITLGATTLTSL